MKFRKKPTFQNLKTAFTTSPILIHPNFSKTFFLKSDTFDYILGAILSKNENDDLLFFIAILS
jgi:hypothetical protein